MSAVDATPWRRQPTQEGQTENQCQAAPTTTVDAPSSTYVPPPPSFPPPPMASSVTLPAPPAPPPMAAASCVPSAPAPPPPPPPSLNGGNIPSIRLKSEISDRLEPPSKLQSAMTKDKKPFTYAPGGIDFSEIKSPRMQRRIIRNAQEPEDVILPPTSSAPVNTSSLPPAACVGMMPQIAIPVFPQNNPMLNKKSTVGRPVSPTPAGVGRPVSPIPTLNVGRPVSPIPSSAGRPMSPVSMAGNGRPMSPMLGPNAGQRSVSPMPHFGMGRPVSPVSASAGRPMSPVSMSNNGRPMSPMSVSNNSAQRSVSPMPAFGARPISPSPSPAARPISPVSISVQRPLSPISPPQPPQRHSHLPQQYSSVPKMIPVSNSPNIQVNQNNLAQRTIIVPAADNPRSQIGTIYVPLGTQNESPIQRRPTSPSFPTLREAATPWFQKQQNQPMQENVAPWVNRNNEQNLRNEEPKEKMYELKPRATTIQVQSNDMPYMNFTNGTAGNFSNNTTGAHVIPIRTDNQSPFIHQQSQQGNVQRQANPQRWQNNNGETYITIPPQNNANNRMPSNSANKVYIESDSKPIQSRSFKVLQKITGSEDDTTDFNSNIPYNSEGVPLSQLRKLHLNNDDQAFMNQVKAQVDEDTFLHMDTDPRYRGAAIPSKAFRMLQNMTDAGQVTTNTITAALNHNHNHYVTVNSKQPHVNVVVTQSRPTTVPTVIQPSTDNEANTKGYIPPSERQAEQEFRKYMGSSIPSRSFKMLQAMTATQDTDGRTDSTDF